MCYIINDKSEVLLIMKKRGFGVGKWNGPGGKVEKDENPKESMIREIKEEIGVEVVKPEPRGQVRFLFPHKPKWDMEVTVFVIEDWQGDPCETEVILPNWYSFDDLPREQMWDDNLYWLPRLLSGKKVRGTFLYDKSGKVVEHTYQDLSDQE